MLLPLEALRYLLDEADYLLRAASHLEAADFLADETLKRAFARSVEVIGRIAGEMPADLRERYPAIEWRAIAGMQDRLIDRHLGVDYELVWDAVVTKVPELRIQVELLIAAETDG